MGSGVSKLDNSPLVSLCKERKELIKATEHCRHDLVSAHLSYFESLLNVGDALHQYVEQELIVFDADSHCGDSELMEEEHVQLEDDYMDKPDVHRSSEHGGHRCTHHRRRSSHKKRRGGGGVKGNAESFHNKSSNASCSAMHGHDSRTKNIPQSDFHHGNPQYENWPPINYYSYTYQHTLPNDVLHGNLKSREQTSKQNNATSTITPPPLPTPPPPQSSAWDFDKIFNTNYDAYNYIVLDENSQSSLHDEDIRDIREREGIPDLEEDENCDEHISTFHQLNLDKNEISVEGEICSGSDSDNNETFKSEKCNSKEYASLSKEEEIQTTKKEVEGNNNSTFSPEINLAEDSEEPIKAKKKESNLNSSACKSRCDAKLISLREAISDIKGKFETISLHGGKEFCRMLEVGKLPHDHPTTTIFKGMTQFRTLSNRSASRTRVKLNANNTNKEEHLCPKFGYLSSTLDKLYIWEKKLHDEVKGEEKLRVLYDKECKRCKDLDNAGAETERIDEAHASMRMLNSEINVSVAAIKMLSRRIQMLRDEELLPQLNELIKGLIKFWKFMSMSYQKQLQTIARVKGHVHIAELELKTGLRSDATLKMEKKILNLGDCFTNLVDTQKAFVKYLNEWLSRCILSEPEGNKEGEVPNYSPSKIGAPPVFIVANDWRVALNKISKAGVSKAIDDFASCLHQLYQKQNEEHLQRHRAVELSKDFESKLQSFYKMNGINSHLDKPFSQIALPGGPVYESLVPLRSRLLEQRARHEESIRQVNDAVSRYLQPGLLPIFEAMWSFCQDVVKAYEQIRFPNAAIQVE